MCSFEVTGKIKQLEVEEGNVPQCPIAGDANVYRYGLFLLKLYLWS